MQNAGVSSRLSFSTGTVDNEWSKFVAAGACSETGGLTSTTCFSHWMAEPQPPSNSSRGDYYRLSRDQARRAHSVQKATLYSTLHLYLGPQNIGHDSKGDFPSLLTGACIGRGFSGANPSLDILCSSRGRAQANYSPSSSKSVLQYPSWRTSKPWQVVADAVIVTEQGHSSSIHFAAPTSNKGKPIAKIAS